MRGGLLTLNCILLISTGCTGVIDYGGTGGDDPVVEGVDAGSTGIGLGYPVGDKTSSPAGGWQVWQVLGHYWGAWGGRHLAQDLAAPFGEETVGQPVYSVGDGVVRYAGPNSSTYKNVVLIEHDLGDQVICSFYGHVTTPLVETGQAVSRGQQVTTVIDWAEAAGGPQSNSHLHYVLLSKAMCDVSANAGGTSICG